MDQKIIPQPALVEQPSLAPTRKVAAVGWVSLVGPVIAGGIATALPAVSDACTSEVGMAVAVVAASAAQGAASFIAGYMRKERA
jgi:hypothetical protein